MGLNQETVDLHIHTTASDGATSPDKLLDEAEAVGLVTLSLTDHESITGMDAISSQAAQRGLNLIPGVEFLTFFQDREIHLLGYCFDIRSDVFRSRVKELRQERNKTSMQIVDNFCRLGFKVDKESFYKVVDEGGTIGKNHIIRSLFQAGYLKTKEQAIDILRRYLTQNGVAYVKFRRHPFLEAGKLIRECKGIPVLAHPGLIRDDRMVLDLLSSASVGLEVYYNYFDTNRDELITHYERMAQERGLVTTGGSDYHGNYTPDVKLGCITIPQETIDHLMRHIERKTN